MDYKKIKVTAVVNGAAFEEELSIPMDSWNDEMEMLAREVGYEMLDDDNYDEEDLKNTTGYIDDDGLAHDCTPAQANIAYYLLCRACELEKILYHLEVLGDLRDSIVKDMEGKTEFEDVLPTIKNITDFDKDILGEIIDEEGSIIDNVEPIIKIIGEFPLEILDEIAERLEDN